MDHRARCRTDWTFGGSELKTTHDDDHMCMIRDGMEACSFTANAVGMAMDLDRNACVISRESSARTGSSRIRVSIEYSERTAAAGGATARQ